MAKIRDLSAMPGPAVYRRNDGKTYAKLNEGFHVIAKLSADGRVIGEGTAEAFDPDEEVILLNPKERP